MQSALLKAHAQHYYSKPGRNVYGASIIYLEELPEDVEKKPMTYTYIRQLSPGFLRVALKLI